MRYKGYVGMHISSFQFNFIHVYSVWWVTYCRYGWEICKFEVEKWQVWSQRNFLVWSQCLMGYFNLIKHMDIYLIDPGSGSIECNISIGLDRSLIISYSFIESWNHQLSSETLLQTHVSIFFTLVSGIARWNLSSKL